MEMLRAHDIELDTIQYLDEAPGFSDLKALAAMLDTDARGIMRTGEELYKVLGLDNPAMDEEGLFRILADNPQLLQRPIVVRGSRAIIGRPPENVMQLLDEA